MGSPRVRWLWLAVLVIVVNAAAVVLSARRKPSVPSDWIWSESAHQYQVILYDEEGLLTVTRDLASDLAAGPMLVRPASKGVSLRRWWPAIACATLSLLVVGVLPILGRWIPRRDLHTPRVTMLQVMALIGAISVWLWLARINWVLITGGTTVLVLLLLSAQRRGSVAREITARGKAATALSRACFVGYSIAILLALAWVTCIVIWDSYRDRRP